MSAGRMHIVGAGIAGLSAALAVAADGGEAVLYEASPQPGGRCRTLHPEDDFSHDNGTHVLLTANWRALKLLETIGAREQWIEPERQGLPLYDSRTGTMRRVGLSPWSWVSPSRRPRDLSLFDLSYLLRLAFPKQECSVASIVGDRPIMKSLIGPLTLAVLNTPPDIACAQRLAFALRRLLWPGAGRLLVARNGLSEDLVQPAVEALQARGAPILAGQRLKNILIHNERVIGLTLTDRTIALGPKDRVILALPPYEIERLMPSLEVPKHFEAILNVHYRLPGLRAPRFIGLIGTLAQWVLIRKDHVSVTVSAANAESTRDVAAIIWREVAAILQNLGLEACADRQPEARVVKEKRATIRQAAAPLPQPPIRPLVNMALAGDWIGSLPATIESAVVSGEKAVAALRDVPHAASSATHKAPSQRENAA